MLLAAESFGRITAPELSHQPVFPTLIGGLQVKIVKIIPTIADCSCLSAHCFFLVDSMACKLG